MVSLGPAPVHSHRPVSNEWCLGRNKAGDLWREVLRPSLVVLSVDMGRVERGEDQRSYRVQNLRHRTPLEREIPCNNAACIFQVQDVFWISPVGGVLANALVEPARVTQGDEKKD